MLGWSSPNQPQIGLAGVGPAGFAQDLDDGFVQVDDWPGAALLVEQADEWLTGPGHLESPAAHGCPGDVQARRSNMRSWR